MSPRSAPMTPGTPDERPSGREPIAPRTGGARVPEVRERPSGREPIAPRTGGARAPEVYERLVALLGRFGSPSMARLSVHQAVTNVYGSRAAANGSMVERVVEETMTGFRVFCSDEERRALWIELVDFCERERGTASR